MCSFLNLKENKPHVSAFKGKGMEKISSFNAQTGKKKEVSYIAGWIKEANGRMHTHNVFCVF